MQMTVSGSRALFNELTTLLEQLDAGRLALLVQRFPAFEKEVKYGPDAGEADIDRAYHEDRAAFTSALCSELVPAINRLADKTIARASSLNSSRLLVALLAAVGGATTLGAIGIGKEEVARISGIVTSGVAIINAGLDSMSKRYTASETQKAIELKKAALQLGQLQNDMDLAVKHGREVTEIASSIERCNQIALDLNQRKDQLRII
ncbi:hypothetical protein [Roseateles paludis]|jgi:uncharacterized alkaline shock family protein YloU|uniref:Chemotaxis protein n=1 Tax=Roseateles paludis TaxID=3145238 RepID=A0ABV0FYJ0_9BURK